MPTPQPLVEKMLDMAKVTPQDFVMDLGSGDGRTVITAAKRGATRDSASSTTRTWSRCPRATPPPPTSTAKATFRKADLFETDLSKATVITMFLLPVDQHEAPAEDPRSQARHAHRDQHLHDGGLGGRSAETISGDCSGWCTALLWIVPAKVEGTWKVTAGGNRRS